MKGKELLEFHEGLRLEPYKDSLGYWTIGFGHLIDRRVGGTVPKTIPLTLQEAEELLDLDLKKHKEELDRELPWAKDLDEVRYYILLDMTFNLGIEPFDGDGFKDWPIFVGQVKRGDFKSAAVNMRKTLWADQVGQRAIRLSMMMEFGKWPEEPGVPKVV